MSASNKTITIRQGCRYAWREWNIFWKLSPKFFYATFASAALTALSLMPQSGCRPSWWANCPAGGTRTG